MSQLHTEHLERVSSLFNSAASENTVTVSGQGAGNVVLVLIFHPVDAGRQLQTQKAALGQADLS